MRWPIGRRNFALRRGNAVARRGFPGWVWRGTPARRANFVRGSGIIRERGWAEARGPRTSERTRPMPPKRNGPGREKASRFPLFSRRSWVRPGLAARGPLGLRTAGGNRGNGPGSCFVPLLFQQEAADHHGVDAGGVEAAHGVARGADQRISEEIEGGVVEHRQAGGFAESV